MYYNPQKHHRRSIRLKGYDYSGPGMYFITICTQNRELLFGEITHGKMILNNAGNIARKCWLEIPLHYPNVSLDEFIIMPNHVHGIIIIQNKIAVTHAGVIHESPLRESSVQTFDNYKKQRRLMTLSKIIGRFKMNSAKQINLLRNTPGITVWQRNYYDHIIRNKIQFYRIREYIMKNPTRWKNDKFF